MDSNALTTTEAISNLKKRIESVKLPENLVKNLEELFAQLSINSRNEESFWQNYQSVSKYISYLINVPWFAQTKDILDLQFAKEKLKKFKAISHVIIIITTLIRMHKNSLCS